MAEATGQASGQPEGDAGVVDRLAALFGESGDEPAQEEQQQPESDAAPEPVVQEADTDPAETEEESVQDTLTIDPDSPLVEITIKTEGGADETRLWSLNEMKAGVMMHKDYQRKTAELAKARDQLAQEVQQMVEPERQAYLQNLQNMQAAVQTLVMPELQNVDWEKLAVENPAQYVQLSAKYQKAQQALQYAQHQQQQEMTRQFQAQAQHSRQMLSDPIAGIPGWNDGLYTSLINEASKQYGFSPQEVAQVVDYRMIKVLHDAFQYQKVKSAKPAVEKKVMVAPKVLKPGAQADSSDAHAKTEKDLHQRLRKTGDVKDAAALYMARQARKR